MKILALAASSSRNSINKALVTHATQRLQAEFLPDAEVEILDLNDYEMPLYSIDREREGGIPEQAQRFFEQIGQADALVISYAEHNGTYTAAFKNLFDWTSRVQQKIYQHKPMVVMAASPGGRGGAGVLQAALGAAPHFNGDVVADFSLPRFGSNFDAETGALTNPELAEGLGQALKALAERLVNAS